MAASDQICKAGLFQGVRDMAGTFSSWGALVQALQQEVADATEEVIKALWKISERMLTDSMDLLVADISVLEH